ncbi:hypothetical protein NP233_g10532 [Leucocoprinus birnbaumii]|uniref:Ribonuclease H1 N-terminal domain-containing protein n=1 Tax=Leucocoprinus birnbaumii TaxID=56174 RepID=A0AAD5VKK1_9AGAR|nr:hypothetical protein NP233_g10532 [Leucocoprinus birnbaumii]
MAHNCFQGIPINNAPFVIPVETGLHGCPLLKDEKSHKESYVVANGRRMGVYYDWLTCAAQVMGFPKNSYKGYKDKEDSEGVWHYLLRNGLWGPPDSESLCLALIPDCLIHILAPLVIPAYQWKGVESLLGLDFHHQDLGRSPSSGPIDWEDMTSIAGPEEVSNCTPAPMAKAGSSKGKGSYAQHCPAHVFQKLGLSSHTREWKVVIKGTAPGIFYGSDKANEAMGDAPI